MRINKIKKIFDKYYLYLDKIQEEYNWSKKLLIIFIHIFFGLGLSLTLLFFFVFIKLMLFRYRDYIIENILVIFHYETIIFFRGVIDYTIIFLFVIFNIMTLIWIGFVLFKVFSNKKNKVSIKVDSYLDLKD